MYMWCNVVRNKISSGKALSIWEYFGIAANSDKIIYMYNLIDQNILCFIILFQFLPYFKYF